MANKKKNASANPNLDTVKDVFRKNRHITNRIQQKTVFEATDLSEKYYARRIKAVMHLLPEMKKRYAAKYPEMDGLFGLSSGMDMVLPAVNEVGRLWSESNSGDGTMKMAALGYNESSEKYLENGTLLIGGTNNYVESVAYLFTMMFDAVNGNNMKTDDASGFEYNASISYPTFSNAEELKDFQTYVLTTTADDFSTCSVTADEMKTVMKAYDGSGSWTELNELVSRDFDVVKAAR